MRIEFSIACIEYADDVQNPDDFLDGLLGRPVRPGAMYLDYGKGAAFASAVLHKAAQALAVPKPEDVTTEAIAAAITGQQMNRTALLEGMPRSFVESLPVFDHPYDQAASDARSLRPHQAYWIIYLTNAQVISDASRTSAAAKLIRRAIDNESARAYRAEASARRTLEQRESVKV